MKFLSIVPHLPFACCDIAWYTDECSFAFTMCAIFCHLQVVHKSHVGKWNSIVKLLLFWNLTWTCASTLVGVFQECCQTLWWSCQCLVTKTFCEAMLSYVAQNCEALLLKFHPKLWNFITKVSLKVVKLYCIGVIWSYVVEKWSCETLWELCMCLKSLEFSVIMCAQWCKTWF